jgi:hypothetical protein
MKELIKKLTEEEFNRFIYNTFFIKPDIELNIRNVLKNFPDALPSDFIHESFIWIETKEDHHYWESVYLRLKNDEWHMEYERT